MSGRYIKQEPYVDNYGMYEPINTYVPEGCESMYRCVITKEMFVEAYNKWIKGEPNVFDNPFAGQDNADDWSED